jgi:hypothetical protein
LWLLCTNRSLRQRHRAGRGERGIDASSAVALRDLHDAAPATRISGQETVSTNSSSFRAHRG